MTAPPVQAPPQARLLGMATGFFLSRIVYLAAKLGIADHLAGGSKTAAELASATGCDVTALYRFMRMLANFDILTLGTDDTFALTPLGEALRSDAPGHTRSTILIMGS